MMPMVHQLKQDFPIKLKYLGKGKLPITEIRRPDPEACLTVKPGEVLELDADQYVLLFHGEKGPLYSETLFEILPGPPKAAKPVPVAPVVVPVVPPVQDPPKSATPADAKGDDVKGQLAGGGNAGNQKQ